MGGKYILRVEDTDRTRLVDGAIENMLNAMKWAGVNHDEGVMLDDNGNVVQKGEYGPYIQSERLDIYKKYIQDFIIVRYFVDYRCLFGQFFADRFSEPTFTEYLLAN